MDIRVEQDVGVIRNLLGLVVGTAKVGIRLVVGELLLDADKCDGCFLDKGMAQEGIAGM